MFMKFTVEYANVLANGVRRYVYGNICHHNLNRHQMNFKKVKNL